MFGYAFSSFKARWRRNLSLALGLSASLAAVIFSYALSYNLDLSTGDALRYVIDDQSIWIVASGGVRLDPQAKALSSGAALSSQVLQQINADSDSLWQQIAASRELIGDVSAIVYVDSRSGPGSSASPSKGLRARLRDVEMVVVGGQTYRLGPVADDLPGVSIRLPWPGPEASRTVHANWVVGSPLNPIAWAKTFAKETGFLVTDTFDPAQEADGRGHIYLLKASLSRFSPFTFQTRSSAAQLSTANSRLLGLLSIGVFGVGVWFTIASALLAVTERANEIAVLASLGLEAEFTVIMLLEAAAVTISAIPLGVLIAAALLLLSASYVQMIEGLLGALPATLFFIPVSLSSSALLAAQRVASQRTLPLIRGQRAL